MVPGRSPLAVFLFCAASSVTGFASPSASVGELPRALTVTINAACSLDDEVRAIVERETVDVWADAGVAVRWVAPADVTYELPRTEWVVVTCTETPTAPRPSGAVPVAAIKFVGHEPINTIVVNLANARMLLRQGPREARELNARLKGLRDTRLGRMVGRAVAHEIGHFLGRSPAHSDGGLMRASHSVPVLTGVSMAPFEVDVDSLAVEFARAQDRSRLRALSGASAAGDSDAAAIR